MLKAENAEMVMSAAGPDQLSLLEVEDGRRVVAPRVAEAARHGEPARLHDALDAGENIEQAQHGLTPLLWATLGGHVAAVKLLLERGADPNAVDKRGTTPLHLAALSSDLDDRASAHVAQLLLTHGAHPSTRTGDGHTPLSLAINRRKSELAQLVEGAASAPAKRIETNPTSGGDHGP